MEIFKLALDQYTPIEAGLAQMKQKYSVLKIVDENDEEGYKAVLEAIAEVKITEKALEEKRKELKADSLEYGRQVDSGAKKIQEELNKIKAPIISEKSRIDDILLEKQKELDRLAREKFNFRISLVSKYGAEFNGTHYKYGSIEVTPKQIEKAPDDKFDAFILKLKAEAEILMEAIRVENERIAAQKVIDDAIIEENKKKALELANKEAELNAKEEIIKKAEIIVKINEAREEGKILGSASVPFSTVTQEINKFKPGSIEIPVEKTDFEKLVEYAEFLRDEGPNTVPNVTEPYAVEIIETIKDQFAKFHNYIIKKLPNAKI